MIVDTSALIAVAAAEPAAGSLLTVLRDASDLAISATSQLECFQVSDRRPDPLISRRIEELIRSLGVIVEPFTERQATIARRAYRDFGKGSGHQAGLNFGDCFSYALAIATDRPLLFVGNDFQHTDVRVAAY